MNDYTMPIRKFEMMDKSNHLMNSPFGKLALIYHLIISIVFLLILIFIALWLWEKVKAERFANRKLEKGK